MAWFWALRTPFIKKKFACDAVIIYFPKKHIVKSITLQRIACRRQIFFCVQGELTPWREKLTPLPLRKGTSTPLLDFWPCPPVLPSQAQAFGSRSLRVARGPTSPPKRKLEVAIYHIILCTCRFQNTILLWRKTEQANFSDREGKNVSLNNKSVKALEVAVSRLAAISIVAKPNLTVSI